MKKQILIVLTASASFLIAGAVQAHGDGDATKGKAIYEGTCVFCHGAKGKGEIPGTPDFTRADGVLAKEDAVLVSHITDGFESAGSAMPMPAKGGNPDLSDEDVENVLAYLHQAFGS